MLITALSCSSFAAGTHASLIQDMENKELTFNDLSQVVSGLRDEVAGMKVLLSDLQKGQTQQRMQRTRRTMNVEEAADYLRMPLNTLYQKLQKG